MTRANARKAPTFAPGDRVRLTRQFLKNTGQYGSEGHSRWTVTACDCSMCASGQFVATDETSQFGDGARHFNSHNLERVRQ
jgi:hypothetical protein